MPPMPENTNVPNPTLSEKDRDTRVRFLQTWSYAYAGIHTVRYLEHEVADVSEQCAKLGTELGVLERTEADIFDPRLDANKKKLEDLKAAKRAKVARAKAEADAEAAKSKK